MTKLTTILFGSIGTLVETSELQRQAFNEAFREADLGWDWDVGTYKELLGKSGGRQRIEDYANSRGMAVDASALHDRKTVIFDRKMVDDGLNLRSGVHSVIRAAQSQGLSLGFVTSTSRANIDAVFDGLGDQINSRDFDFIGDASMVENSKPAPDIYEFAMTALEVDPDACIAIEDTAVSMKAARAAGLRCVAFPGAYADVDAFDNGTEIERDALSFDDLIGN